LFKSRARNFPTNFSVPDVIGELAENKNKGTIVGQKIQVDGPLRVTPGKRQEKDRIFLCSCSSWSVRGVTVTINKNQNNQLEGPKGFSVIHPSP